MRKNRKNIFLILRDSQTATTKIINKTTQKSFLVHEPLGSSRWATGIPLRFRDRGNEGARESLEAFARFSVLTLGEATTFKFTNPQVKVRHERIIRVKRN